MKHVSAVTGVGLIAFIAITVSTFQYFSVNTNVFRAQADGESTTTCEWFYCGEDCDGDGELEPFGCGLCPECDCPDGYYDPETEICVADSSSSSSSSSCTPPETYDTQLEQCVCPNGLPKNNGGNCDDDMESSSSTSSSSSSSSSSTSSSSSNPSSSSSSSPSSISSSSSSSSDGPIGGENGLVSGEDGTGNGISGDNGNNGDDENGSGGDDADDAGDGTTGSNGDVSGNNTTGNGNGNTTGTNNGNTNGNGNTTGNNNTHGGDADGTQGDDDATQGQGTQGASSSSVAGTPTGGVIITGGGSPSTGGNGGTQPLGNVFCACLPDNASQESCTEMSARSCINAGGIVINDAANSESDCMAWQEENGCPACLPLGNADESKDRVNVVFVGNGYYSVDQAENQAQAFKNNLMSWYPYRQNDDKIQFWISTKLSDPNLPSPGFNTRCEEVCKTTASCGLSNEYSAVVCNTDCRSNARRHQKASWTSTEGNDLRVFTHEFQHQFLGVPDEYTEEGRGSFPRKPSCAPNREKAEAWWGYLVGKDGFEDVGYYDGCKYEESNIRPHQNGIMRNHWMATRLGGVVEARALEYLSSYTGNTINNPKLGSTNTSGGFFQFFANIFANIFGGNDDRVPSDEYALQARLRRQPDGSYKTVDLTTVRVSNEVKPTFEEEGYAVMVTIGDQVFSQTVGTVETSIAEHFHEDGTIELASYNELALPEVTALVGVGEIELLNNGNARMPDGSEVRFAVSTSQCDSTDDNNNNDCPPPMISGEILPSIFCGDGEVDPGEDCDDGNANDNDSCPNSCLFSTTLSAQLITAQQSSVALQVQQGSSSSSSRSFASYARAICGDGKIDTSEECDNGERNADSADQCRSTCTLPRCGDAIRDTGEDCDDGNTINEDFCSKSCTFTIAQAPQSSSSVPASSVSSVATISSAQSSSMPSTQVQSSPSSSSLSSFSSESSLSSISSLSSVSSLSPLPLSPPFCGDGILQASTGEQCDNGENNANEPSRCRTNCTLPQCGDGIVDAGEQCDDANTAENDGCSSLCKLEQQSSQASSDSSLRGSAPEEITHTPNPLQTPTGPALIVFLASGAAAGIGYARRKK